MDSYLPAERVNREQALRRIVELAVRWQDPAIWNIILRCDEDEERLRQQCNLDHQKERDSSLVAAKLLRDSIRMNQDAAAALRDHSCRIWGELIELQNLVRVHVPLLLTLTVTFSEVVGPIQDSQICELKRLEDAVRALLAPVALLPKVKQAALAFSNGNAKHSEHFDSINWFGSTFTFGPNQAKVVKALWEAWEKGTPGVCQADLLYVSESSGKRIRDLFKSAEKLHPAWDTMIVKVEGSKNHFRLSDENFTKPT